MILNKIMEKCQNIRKLNTHEDIFYIHKLLGFIVLSNYIYRFYLLNIYYDMHLYNLSSMILLVFHSLLSFSSLIFTISNVRNRKIPIIYPEFRMHNIAFALRSVFCCFSFYFLNNNKICVLTNMFICFVTMKIADEITKYYHSTKNKEPVKILHTTMNNMPYDTSLSVHKIENLKKIYSYMQMYATYYMLGNINSAFIPMFAIQLSSFLMTLVKKNIINPMLWHPLYFISLLSNMFVFFTLTPFFIIKMNILCSLFSYWRIELKYNKYIGWLIVFTFHYFISFENNSYDNYWFSFLFQTGDKMVLMMKGVMSLVFIYHFYKYPVI